MLLPQIFCCWKCWFPCQSVGYLRDALRAYLHKAGVSFLQLHVCSFSFCFSGYIDCVSCYVSQMACPDNWLQLHWRFYCFCKWRLVHWYCKLYMIFFIFLFSNSSFAKLGLGFINLSNDWNLICILFAILWNSQMFILEEQCIKFLVGLLWTVLSGILNTIYLHMLVMTKTSIRLMKV